jgi:uncharacterized protein DUF4019
LRRWIVQGILAGIALGIGGAAHGAQPKPTPTPTPTREKPGLDVAGPWLAMVDAEQYGESWDASATLFKQSVTREQWVAALTKSRTPLGRVQARTLQAARYQTDLPGAPSGEYVQIQYDTTFLGGGESTETITPMKDADGVWRVSGYFIRPAK